MRSEDPPWGRVARDKLPKTCCQSAPGREEQSRPACSAGPGLNRHKFPVNKFGLCIRRIWDSFPHVGKPTKIVRPFVKRSTGLCLAQERRELVGVGCELPLSCPHAVKGNRPWGVRAAPTRLCHLVVQSHRLLFMYRSCAKAAKGNY